MCELQISNLSSNYSKTMCYYLASIFEEHNAEKQDIEQFIKQDIGSYEYIMEQIEYKIDNLRYVKILTDNDSKYKISTECAYYNYALNTMLIEKIKVYFDDIKYEINEENIMCNIKLFSKIREIIVHLNLAISDFAISNSQRKGEFDFSKRYMPSPLLIGYLVEKINYWRLYCDSFINIESKEAKKILELNLKSDIDYLKGKISYIELQHAMICILKSPFYDDEHKKLLYAVYNKVQEIMHNCNVMGVYTDVCFINQDIPLDKRTSNDRSTRIQILFILDDGKPFSLRIDLPHKGVNFVHININNLYGESALPIDENKFYSLCKIVDKDILRKVFYEKDYKYWFGNKFESKINKLEISSHQKEILLQTFKENSHYNLKNIYSENDIKIVKYFDELAIYLSRNMYSNYYLLNKGKMDYKKILKKSIFKLEYSSVCLLLSLPRWNRGEDDVDKYNSMLEDVRKRLVSLLYDFYEYDEFEMKEVNNLELIQLLEIIDEEIYK